MKLNFIIVFILSFYFTIETNSQNLVPNGQFEKADTSICTPPSYIGLSAGYYPWIGAGGSPDYFNTCDTSNYVGVPINRFGYQYTHSGRGYFGLDTYSPLGFDREYIEVLLSDSLLAGQTYYVHFFVSLTDSSLYSIKNMGHYLPTHYLKHFLHQTIFGKQVSLKLKTQGM